MQITPLFRLIVINTNYCARLNIWTLYEPSDPAGHLKWIQNELLKAENDDNYVHIVGHLPPDSRECTQAWLYNYIQIVTRFQDIIKGQFYGHTHADEIRMIYSVENSNQPVGVEYLSPSLTPWDRYNPAYRIYQSDLSGQILDYHTYYFDLHQENLDSFDDKNTFNSRKQRNQQSSSQWHFGYSAKQMYQMSNFSVDSWFKVVNQIKSNKFNMFNNYYQMYFHKSNERVNQNCNDECKHDIINDIDVHNPFIQQPKRIKPN